MSGAIGSFAIGLSAIGVPPPANTTGLPTTIPSITPDGFAARTADLFPRGWCSDDAKQTGNVYALLLAVGQDLTFVQQELQYALAAQRLQSETYPELDLASLDFFGGSFPRPAGTDDATFEAAIIAQLFQPAATRSALQNALTSLTGFVPRMLEPWSVQDTGAWGSVSYWNVDTVANPARWGDGGLRYQGFIETAPPSIAAIGVNNPIQCWGDSAYWNQPGYFFGILQPVDENAVNNLVNKLRAYGTVVWIKLVSSSSLPSAVAPTPITNLTATSSGSSSVLLNWNAPLAGSPPFTFTVLYRQTGTTAFVSGPTVSTTSVTMTNLAANTGYDFEILARNAAGSSTSAAVTQTTTKVAPSAATGLTSVLVQATAVTLDWFAPATGTPPFTYVVQYRVTGTIPWQTFNVTGGSTSVTVINLLPSTSYDFEVVASNL